MPGRCFFPVIVGVFEGNYTIKCMNFTLEVQDQMQMHKKNKKAKSSAGCRKQVVILVKTPMLATCESSRHLQHRKFVPFFFNIGDTLKAINVMPVKIEKALSKCNNCQ